MLPPIGDLPITEIFPSLSLLLTTPYSFCNFETPGCISFGVSVIVKTLVAVSKLKALASLWPSGSVSMVSSSGVTSLTGCLMIGVDVAGEGSLDLLSSGKSFPGGESVSSFPSSPKWPRNEKKADLIL